MLDMFLPLWERMSVKIDMNILQSPLIVHNSFLSLITHPMLHSFCDFYLKMVYEHDSPVLFHSIFDALLFQVVLWVVCKCVYTWTCVHTHVWHIYACICVLFLFLLVSSPASFCLHPVTEELLVRNLQIYTISKNK